MDWCDRQSQDFCWGLSIHLFECLSILSNFLQKTRTCYCQIVSLIWSKSWTFCVQSALQSLNQGQVWKQNSWTCHCLDTWRTFDCFLPKQASSRQEFHPRRVLPFTLLGYRLKVRLTMQLGIGFDLKQDFVWQQAFGRQSSLAWAPQSDSKVLQTIPT